MFWRIPLTKNVDSLKTTDPGRAYNILKKMGAQPGEYDDCTFTLPSHENLNVQEAAEKICEHFSKISQEYPPLEMKNLPDRVRNKIENPENDSKIPVIQEHEVHDGITAANKPKSGVPGDLPRKLVAEFGPELSTPICEIFNKILMSAKQGSEKWTDSWKLEYGTPLQKTPNPQD